MSNSEQEYKLAHERRQEQMRERPKNNYEVLMAMLRREAKASTERMAKRGW